MMLDQRWQSFKQQMYHFLIYSRFSINIVDRVVYLEDTLPSLGLEIVPLAGIHWHFCSVWKIWRSVSCYFPYSIDMIVGHLGNWTHQNHKWWSPHQQPKQVFYLSKPKLWSCFRWRSWFRWVTILSCSSYSSIVAISNNCNINYSSASNLGHSFRVPIPGYEAGSEAARTLLAGNSYFQVQEIEVFRTRIE